MPVQKNSMESMGSIQRGKWGLQDGSRETGVQVGSRKSKMVLSTACGRHHAKELSLQRRKSRGTQRRPLMRASLHITTLPCGTNGSIHPQYLL